MCLLFREHRKISLGASNEFMEGEREREREKERGKEKEEERGGQANSTQGSSKTM